MNQSRHIEPVIELGGKHVGSRRVLQFASPEIDLCVLKKEVLAGMVHMKMGMKDATDIGGLKPMC